MSPQSGIILTQQIAPRLRATIPSAVKTVGSEDAEELIQDGLAMAAQMLESLERRGKTVTPGNVAYYVILTMKSGRRSQYASRTDVMAEGTQLDHTSSVLSVEDEVGYDPELDEPIRLGELLSGDGEDPSKVAGRAIDWEQFLGTHDYRYGVIARDLAEGKTVVTAARECSTKYSAMVQLNYRMADELREFLGADAVADCLRVSSWAGTVHAERERAACRSERTTCMRARRSAEAAEARCESKGGW